MAIFYNLGACEVLPHNPGEPYRIKKPYRDFLLCCCDTQVPSTKLSHFFVFFFVYFHINARDIEEKTMDVFKLIFAL